MTPAWLKGLPALRTEAHQREATGLAWSVFIGPDQVLEAAGRLDGEGYFLEDVSGLDAAEGFLVTYHFDHWQRPGRVALRVLLAHEAPILPSISDVFGGAEWHERECRDFFGVQFEGNPNPGALLLPADFEIHPLCKEAEDRKPLRELLTQGEVIASAEGFDLFAPADEPAARPDDASDSGAPEEED